MCKVIAYQFSEAISSTLGSHTLKEGIEEENCKIKLVLQNKVGVNAYSF